MSSAEGLEHNRRRLKREELDDECKQVLSVHMDAYQPPPGFCKAGPSTFVVASDGYPRAPCGALLLWAQHESQLDHDSDVPSLDQEWKGGERLWLMQAHWVAAALDKDVPGEMVLILGVVSSWRAPDSDDFATHGLKTWWYTPDAFSKAGVMRFLETDDDEISRWGPAYDTPAHFTAGDLVDLTSETALAKIRERLIDHAGRKGTCVECERDTDSGTVWCVECESDTD